MKLVKEDVYQEIVEWLYDYTSGGLLGTHVDLLATKAVSGMVWEMIPLDEWFGIMDS